MRAFISAEIPDEVGERLAEAARMLDFPGIKFVDKKNMHLTFAFLGDFDGARVDDVKDILDNIALKNFDVEIAGMSYLGNPGAIYSRVVIGAEEMKAIAASIRTGLRSRRIAFDNKEFVPHVTVARIKYRIDESALKNALGSFESMSFGRFISGNIIFFRSILGGKEPAYEKLYERKERSI